MVIGCNIHSHATNNYAKEDDTDPEWIETNKQLQAIKLTCFSNLVVCKFKMQEWQSIVGITDQILDQTMSPGNVKALYFRAQAQIKLENFEDAVKCIQQILVKDPEHLEAKSLLVKAIKLRQDFRDIKQPSI